MTTTATLTRVPLTRTLSTVISPIDAEFEALLAAEHEWSRRKRALAAQGEVSWDTPVPQQPMVALAAPAPVTRRRMTYRAPGLTLAGVVAVAISLTAMTSTLIAAFHTAIV
ncbi:hypothetical protein [Oryzihumus leptocrescens]|uniref:Uncharacterized protein n=1 Tax=Oryzihumus leptocrescens TaxID=297536 RepID=A0A542ZEJ6_9MICO|nr:hypothetical protein [Oryzihumus leptocrescens]TQL58758.1 hypothetical protein FB474_0095 [Oryzihumus leptocrescens]